MSSSVYCIWQNALFNRACRKTKAGHPLRKRVLSMEKARELLAMFGPHTPKDACDLALSVLALDTGLRSSELAHLTLKNLDLQERTLSVIVKGGNGKPPSTPKPPPTASTNGLPTATKIARPSSTLCINATNATNSNVTACPSLSTNGAGVSTSNSPRTTSADPSPPPPASFR
ncbi:tyrosine-type recombinase/integrase [Candidatus Villigracilis saccharophilus]|uniref:tyrosine-type recombinase/integrase n=1 Tax=Candidatus Villigracilis saccharophilus TaxID=3140684 RepID=UPI0031350C77|nr:hypothetical protein [Anaerolineales bacterium]